MQLQRVGVPYKSEKASWMQALVRIVVEQMGGSASAGELAQRCWDHMQQLKYRQDTSHPRTT